MTARNNKHERKAPLTLVYIINEEWEIGNRHPNAENKHEEAAFEETLGSPKVGNALHKTDSLWNVHTSPQISNTFALVMHVKGTAHWRMVSEAQIDHI